MKDDVNHISLVTKIRAMEGRLLKDIDYNNMYSMNSILEIGDQIGFISKGSMIWQGDKDTILQTECQPLLDFVCANTLARNIIKNKR